MEKFTVIAFGNERISSSMGNEMNMNMNEMERASEITIHSGVQRLKSM